MFIHLPIVWPHFTHVFWSPKTTASWFPVTQTLPPLMTPVMREPPRCGWRPNLTTRCQRVRYVRPEKVGERHMAHAKTEQGSTPPKINMEPENTLLEEEIIFQTIIFRFYVNLRGCNLSYEEVQLHWGLFFRLVFLLLSCLGLWGVYILLATENHQRSERKYIRTNPLHPASQCQMMGYS